MRNRITTMIALTVCLLAVAVPITAALYLAHRQSMEAASSQSMAMAGEVLRRAEVMGEQATTAYGLVSRLDSAAPCSAASLARMSRISLDYSYLQAVGYVSDDHIVCSSLGALGDGARLGPVQYISSMGAKIRTKVDLGTGTRFLVLQKGNFVAVVHPLSLLDSYSDQADVSLGIYGRSQQQAMAGRGYFDPAWLTHLGKASSASFFDGKHLVAIQASGKFDMAAYAAVPASYLKSRLRAFVVILLPIGLALGTLMVLVVIYLARQRDSLPAVLRSALKRQEFVLHYQPIVDLASGRMIGAEALLRWPGNEDRNMRPALFIQAAEDCGLIQRFTEYVLAHVASDAQQFFSSQPDSHLSINLSPADLHSEHIVDLLRCLVATPGVIASNIIVEVTEHSFLEPTRAQRTIKQIRELGIRVAIDDFGTGFSSLSHLTHLKADYLKIDKVFVDAIGTDSVTSEVVLHIIEMAKVIDLTLIGEGVETRAQAEFLRRHGVPYAQGWLFGKAKPMADLLREHG